MQGKFNLLVETLTARDKSIDNDFKTLMRRLDRHRGELDGMTTKVGGCSPWVFHPTLTFVPKIDTLDAQVLSMQDRLCHCGEREALSSSSSSLSVEDRSSGLDYVTPELASPPTGNSPAIDRAESPIGEGVPVEVIDLTMTDPEDGPLCRCALGDGELASDSPIEENVVPIRVPPPGPAVSGQRCRKTRPFGKYPKGASHVISSGMARVKDRVLGRRRVRVRAHRIKPSNTWFTRDTSEPTSSDDEFAWGWLSDTNVGNGGGGPSRVPDGLLQGASDSELALGRR